MTEKATSLPLNGRTVAVPESRKLDVFAGMLEKKGASVWRCPLVSIHDSPHIETIENWIQFCADGNLDDLILLTGEGLRRLLGFAERAGGDLKQKFIESLQQVRKITRGPKPVVALRQIGLNTDLSAIEPTTDGVIKLLSGELIQGRNIGVQLYGTDPNDKLISFLKRSGAKVHIVAPYVYADDSENQKVENLIKAILSREVDAIAFTSSQQVHRLLQVAKKQNTKPDLINALNKITIAAVGPVVRDVLQENDIQVQLMPDNSYFMKPLTDELVAKFN